MIECTCDICGAKGGEAFCTRHWYHGWRDPLLKFQVGFGFDACKPCTEKLHVEELALFERMKAEATPKVGVKE